MSEPYRPYVVAATFCDRVIEGKDNVLTLVRLVDQMTISPRLPRSGPMPVIPIHATLALCLKSSGDPRTYTISIVMTMPDGREAHLADLDAKLGDPGSGTNIVVNIELATGKQGLHQFGIFADGTLLTRVPLTLTFEGSEPLSTSSAPEAARESAQETPLSPPEPPEPPKPEEGEL